MDSPKVSILIPTYRQPELVSHAVQSALEQDYKPLEVIVCDDSQDNETKERLTPFTADARFYYVKNRQRLGRAGNYRQALYQHASGVWVLMLDGDDYLTDPRFISDAVRVATQQKGIVFVQGGGEIRRQTNGGKSELISTRIPRVKRGASVVRGSDYVKMFPVKRYFLHLTTLFHRETAMKIDFYREDFLSSDLESFMRLALHGKVALIERPVGVWLQHGANAGKKASMEEVIQNGRWADKVAAYAISNNLLPKRAAERWVLRVRHREMIGVLMREINTLKSQGNSKLDIFNCTIAFLKRFPRLACHPVLIKKLVCFYLLPRF